MSRQANSYEKVLFELIKDFDTRFYYESIYKVVDNDQFKIKVEKGKDEMVGLAYVTLPDSNRVDYEIRYNRIVNLNDSYTLLAPSN